MVARARAGLPYGRPASPMLAPSVMVERGGDLLRRPTEATLAPPAVGRVRRVASFRTCQLGGRLGLLAPDPRQRAAWPSGLPFGGSDIGSRARRAKGAPGLRGSRRATGAPRRGTCEAPPIRHGSCRDTFPSGEGMVLVALGRGSPTVAPLRVRVARFAMGAGGGDLLRRPTEATLAPPAMGRVRKQQRVQEPVPAPVESTITAKGVQGGNSPLAPQYRVAVRPLRTVTPASAARPLRAVPPRNLHDTSTRT